MLEVTSLAARRGGRKVFRDVSFTLGASAALIVRGANGSGKSSLLRTLAGLIQPEAGQVLWQGAVVEPASHTWRSTICYLSHLDALKPELTVTETLDYWRALNGVGKSNSKNILENFGLSGLENKPVRTLSAGQKRRLGLTRLLLAPVPLWLLDEPATALDTAGHGLLDSVLAQHRAAGGMAVIVTHHDDATPDAQTLQMGA